MIQIERQPVIEFGDIAQLTELCTTFQRVTFNSRGEMVAQLDFDTTIFGKLVVSYYAAGNHIQLQRDGKAIYSGEFYDEETDNEIVSRAQLIEWVKAQLLRETTKALTPAEVV